MSGFNDIVGQEHIKQHLRRALETGQVGHAYIISGERSSGKDFVAKTFARALNCERSSVEPCEECSSCKRALAGSHPDIIRVIHDKPNVISVDDIRIQVSGTMHIKPMGEGRKVYIIEDAEKMNESAQNALLKTLEEPPAYATILLLTQNEGQLLQTIRSRCVALQMMPVENKLMRKYLMENMKVTDYVADMCIAFARGNLGRARMLASTEEFDHIRNEAVSLLKNIHRMEIDDLLKSVKTFSEYKVDIDEFFDILTMWYRDVLLYKATIDVGSMTFKEEISEIRRQSDVASYEGLEHIIDAISNAKKRIRANVNFEMAMELLLLTIRDEMYV